MIALRFCGGAATLGARPDRSAPAFRLTTLSTSSPRSRLSGSVPDLTDPQWAKSSKDEGERYNGGVVPFGFLASHGRPLEPFCLADQLLDAGAQLVERLREEARLVADV